MLEIPCFKDDILVVRQDNDVFLLKEEQNNTEQKVKFLNTEKSIVLNSEKMRNLWFTSVKNSPKICDYIAFYEQNDKWYCVLIELKSKNAHENKAKKQLEKGKQMAKYLSKICNQEITKYRRVIFYEAGKQNKGTIKKNLH